MAFPIPKKSVITFQIAKQYIAIERVELKVPNMGNLRNGIYYVQIEDGQQNHRMTVRKE